MQAREKKRARRLVTLLTGSPWLMIALGLHVIVGAWISVLYLHQERAVALDAGTAIAVGQHRAEPEPPPPEEPPIDRNRIPEERTHRDRPLGRELRRIVVHAQAAGQRVGASGARARWLHRAARAI